MKTEQREHILKEFGLIQCNTCGSTRDKSHFTKNKAKTLGYNTQCKACDKEYRLAVKRIEKDEPVQVNLSWFDKFKMWLSA